MTAGELITSATVRTVLVAGMARILPSDRPRGTNAGRAGRIRERSPARDTLLTSAVSSAVTPRRDSHDVNPLTTFVRSLGNDGALANARPCSRPGSGRTGSSRASPAASSGRLPSAPSAAAVATSAVA